MDANEKREGALLKGGCCHWIVFMLAFLRVNLSKVKFPLKLKVKLDQKIKYLRKKYMQQQLTSFFYQIFVLMTYKTV